MQENCKKKISGKKQGWEAVLLNDKVVLLLQPSMPTYLLTFILRNPCHDTSAVCQTVCPFSVIYRPIKTQSDGSLHFKRIGKKIRIRATAL